MTDFIVSGVRAVLSHVGRRVVQRRPPPCSPISEARRSITFPWKQRAAVARVASCFTSRFRAFFPFSFLGFGSTQTANQMLLLFLSGGDAEQDQSGAGVWPHLHFTPQSARLFLRTDQTKNGHSCLFYAKLCHIDASRGQRSGT